jgi:hypothetical protein
VKLGCSTLFGISAVQNTGMNWRSSSSCRRLEVAKDIVTKL